MEDQLFTSDEVIRTYTHIQDLLVTKYIIKTYSTNDEDIRETALKGMDISNCQNVLELGCGYGFFIEKLQGQLNDQAQITGIDLVEKNREAYEAAISSIGYKGKFIHGDVKMISEMEKFSFDLVISSYSLYFFPHLIKHIARILKPSGIFIAVTHTQNSLIEIIRIIPECMREIGLAPADETAFNRLFRAFSLENGQKLLGPCFRRVERIIYKNSMNFPLDNIDDCIYYVEKKRPFIYKEVADQYPKKVIDLESCLSQKIYHASKEKGGMILTKDDAVFRCYNPTA